MEAVASLSRGAKNPALSPKQSTGSRVCSCRESRGDRKPMPSERSDLLQGTLDVLILKTLSAQAMHGWGIAQRIQQLSQEVLAVNQGSLYPALHRLEEQGWIAAEWGSSENNRRARFYTLTRAGRRQLADETESWERFAAA